MQRAELTTEATVTVYHHHQSHLSSTWIQGNEYELMETPPSVHYANNLEFTPPPQLLAMSFAIDVSSCMCENMILVP
jgi:hypothetical protein